MKESNTFVVHITNLICIILAVIISKMGAHSSALLIQLIAITGCLAILVVFGGGYWIRGRLVDTLFCAYTLGTSIKEWKTTGDPKYDRMWDSMVKQTITSCFEVGKEATSYLPLKNSQRS